MDLLENLDTNNHKEIGLEDHQIFNFHHNNIFKERLTMYFINYIVNDNMNFDIFKVGNGIYNFIQVNKLKVSDKIIQKYNKDKRNINDSSPSSKRIKMTIVTQDTNSNSNNEMIDNDKEMIDNNKEMIDNNNEMIDSNNQMMDNNNEMIDDNNDTNTIRNRNNDTNTIRNRNNDTNTIDKNDIQNNSVDNGPPPLIIKIAKKKLSPVPNKDVNIFNRFLVVSSFFFNRNYKLFKRFLVNLAIEDFTKNFTSLGITYNS